MNLSYNLGMVSNVKQFKSREEEKKKKKKKKRQSQLRPWKCKERGKYSEGSRSKPRRGKKNPTN